MTETAPAPAPVQRWDVVTIFPDYLAPARLSLVGKAIESGIIDLQVHDLRAWTHDRHRTVDDTPYGGGAGMVMRPEPWGEAIDQLLDDADPDNADPGDGEPGDGEPGVLLVPTPTGEVFTQAVAAELAREPRLIVACGRYEGIDARVTEHYRTRIRVREVSIGDYVLNGGEVAALVMIEAVVRLLPGVLGNPDSLTEESYALTDQSASQSASRVGLLEYPNYTKPAQWRGLEVPPVLLSGHHGEIARWRQEQSLQRTAERRPDLLED